MGKTIAAIVGLFFHNVSIVKKTAQQICNLFPMMVVMYTVSKKTRQLWQAVVSTSIDQF